MIRLTASAFLLPAAKVLEVEKRFRHPDRLVILIVGKRAELPDQIQKPGNVPILPPPEG